MQFSSKYKRWLFLNMITNSIWKILLILISIIRKLAHINPILFISFWSSLFHHFYTPKPLDFQKFIFFWKFKNFAFTCCIYSVILVIFWIILKLDAFKRLLGLAKVSALPTHILHDCVPIWLFWLDLKFLHERSHLSLFLLSGEILPCNKVPKILIIHDVKDGSSFRWVELRWLEPLLLEVVISLLDIPSREGAMKHSFPLCIECILVLIPLLDPSIMNFIVLDFKWSSNHYYYQITLRLSQIVDFWEDPNIELQVSYYYFSPLINQFMTPSTV